MNPGRRTGSWRVAASVCAGLLAGCASASPDPLEGLNRATFAFNEQVDEAILRPVATLYTETVPAPLRQGIANMVANPGVASSAINGLLEGEVQYFLDDGTRFAVNSTFGVLGFFDVASQMSIEGHHLSSAKTLRHWGMPARPYVVVPLLGPHDGRALVALPLDMRLSLTGWVAAPHRAHRRRHRDGDKPAIAVAGRHEPHRPVGVRQVPVRAARRRQAHPGRTVSRGKYKRDTRDPKATYSSS